MRVAAAIVFLAAACTRDAVRVDANPLRFAGCYKLELGPWSPAFADSLYHAIPLRVTLDTVVAAQGPGWRLLPNIRYPGGHVHTPWWEADRDKVVLNWTNGFTPTIVTLRPRGSALVGEAVALTDVEDIGDPHPRARVTIRRVQCSGDSTSSQPTVK